MSTYPLKRIVGQPCPVCKCDIHATEHEFGRFPLTFCSEYCEVATDEEIKEYLGAKVGDYCVFPCAECGQPTEGELEEHPVTCSSCSPKVRARVRKELLERAMKAIAELQGERGGNWQHFVEEIRSELEK